MIRRYPSTDFATGLRALAALLVVIIHTGAFRDWGIIGNTISDAGNGGVQMFFVLSGFSIAHAYAASPYYGRFMMRRYLRIAPAYYVILGITSVLIATGLIATPFWMEKLGSQLDAYNLFMHLTFLSFLDPTIATSIIGVEWTLPVEMFWYLVLPIILGPRLNIQNLIIFIVASIALAELSGLAFEWWGGEHFKSQRNWAPFGFGGFFAAGALAYWIRNRLAATPVWLGHVGFTLGCGVFLGAVVFGLGNEAVLMGYSIALVVAFMPKSNNPIRRLFEARPMLFIGTLSYGLYLTHMVIIMILKTQVPGYDLWPSLLRFAVVFGLASIVSYGLFRYVEHPANALGRRLAQNMARRGHEGLVPCASDASKTP